MATESLSIRSIDQMTSTLRAMSTSTDLVINTFERMQSVLRDVVNTTTLQTAHVRLSQINYVAERVNTEVQDASSQQKNFNQQIASGKSQAEGLRSSIKHYVTELLNAKNAGKIIAISDEATLMRNRLDLMNYGLDTTPQLQQKVFEAAQRSRGVYETTANAVAKLGIQARGAFTSNDELIAFVEQLNKSFVIAGTSVQGVDSVMLQLTQAMASGRLQGEGLNTVLDNAKPIVQNIADFMGVPVGQIKQLASEGAISAEIIKNAMFAAADEVDAKFNQMPMTFSQVTSSIQNKALMAFQPALQQLSAVTQTGEFQNIVTSIMNGIQVMAQATVVGLDLISQVAMWMQENWVVIEPIIWGVAGAFMGYTLALGIHTAATWLANGAAQAFFTTLLTNPLFWIAVVIGVVIAAITSWIQSVGGLKIAWLICVDAVMTKAEQLQLGFSGIWVAIQNGLDRMSLGFAVFGAGVLNALGIVRVLGLLILQKFINDAINRINALIGFAQKIGVTSIDMIAHVEFATSAAVEEKAARQQRASDLAAQRYQTAADIADRIEGKRMRESAVDAAQRRRQAEIEAEKAAAESEKSAKDLAEESWYSGAGGAQETWDNIAGNTANTAGNTAAMADSVNMMDEELKYMRDMAEQEIINRFTTAELTVNMGGITNQISGQMDLDGISDYLGNVIFETLDTAAEGAY